MCQIMVRGGETPVADAFARQRLKSLGVNNPANRAALGRRAKTSFGNVANSIVNAMSADEEPTDPL